MSELQYSGPSLFYPKLNAAYNKLRPYLSRADDPRVIVGGLESIIKKSDGSGFDVLPDQESIGLIDSSLKEWKCADIYSKDEIYKRLLYLCEEANIISGGYNVGESQINLDLIFLSPVFLLKNMAEEGKSELDYISTHDRNGLYNHLIHESMDTLFARKVLQWDLCGCCEYFTDLKNLFNNIDYEYRKETDGKFSFDRGLQRQDIYDSQIKECMDENNDATAELLKHISMANKLSILDFHSMATYVCSLEIFPSEVIAVNLGNTYGNNKYYSILSHKLESKGPTEFMNYVRSLLDTAYTERTNVFDLLAEDCD